MYWQNALGGILIMLMIVLFYLIGAMIIAGILTLILRFGFRFTSERTENWSFGIAAGCVLAHIIWRVIYFSINEFPTFPTAY